ncbi:MAG: VWA domain-containing protein [Phycisphaerales bacterium]|nr:MAG: VWA domain-containing protein [Phycisphaerales bacterium]
MMEYLSERFAPGPLFGWLCVLFIGLIPLVWFVARRSGRHPTVRFSSSVLLKSLRSTWATRTRFIIPLLRTLAVAALIIALARPQSGGEYQDSSEGIAIQMVLDVSGSMSEEDFIINGQRARRLDAVKAVFEDFVMGRGSLRGRESDLVGMTTFAMYADTPCPLTRDHGSLRDLLRETEIPGWIDGRQVRQNLESDNTSLGDAIVLGTDVLRRAGEQAIAGVPGAEAAKSRVMILLTDGADNPPEFAKATAPNPVEAAKVAATLGIKIYTIGAVGSAEARRQGRFGFFAAPRAQVDEQTLKEIARATGGKYFRATDTKSLVTIYDEIDTLERRKTGERTFRDHVYACKVAMVAGLALLMTELVLVNTRYRKIP